MARRRYRVLEDGVEVRSVIPGAYAASRVTKIFGRLDCPSGLMKMDPKNRVFFRCWYDAVEAGYRPCKVCRPDIPRTGEELPSGHPATESRHIALWDTNPRPYPKRPQCCFYSALSWEEGPDRHHMATGHQVTLEEWLPYPPAARRAVAWGKKLGVPVIDCRILAGNRVLWAPDGPPTPQQRRELRKSERSKSHIALQYPTMRS